MDAKPPLAKLEVLDHGFVRLVDHMGSDLSVARSARVSYDAAWRAGEDQGNDAKLIRYLWKHQHTSPFESVVFIFEVKAPIFVLRQWHRHRTWSYNEVSARYTELPTEFYVPKPEHIGVQSKDNKQGRDINILAEHRDIAVSKIRSACEGAFADYQHLLRHAVPREIARSVLPLATYSHMFATVDLLNLLKFCTLRSASDPQYEIKVYSDAMLQLIQPIVPVCVAAWEAR
jgi:thymidylate synthase (FAD)